MITNLLPNEIFVFGSNLVGNHLGGAAKQALQWGAVMGRGEGLFGQTYAFPTLDEDLKKLSIGGLRASKIMLYTCCKDHPDLTFLLTPVGTGIAGFSHEYMKSLFTNCPDNLVLPPEWVTKTNEPKN